MHPFDFTEVNTAGNTLNRLWVRGGLPDSYLAKNAKNSLKLRKDFIRTYLERDVPRFGPRCPGTRLWV